MNTPLSLLKALNIKESFIQGKNEENILATGRVELYKKEDCEMAILDGSIFYIRVDGQGIAISDENLNSEWISFFKS